LFTCDKEIQLNLCIIRLAQASFFPLKLRIFNENIVKAKLVLGLGALRLTSAVSSLSYFIGVSLKIMSAKFV